MSDELRYSIGVSWFLAVFIWSAFGLMGVFDKIDNFISRKIHKGDKHD